MRLFIGVLLMVLGIGAFALAILNITGATIVLRMVYVAVGIVLIATALPQLSAAVKAISAYEPPDDE